MKDEVGGINHEKSDKDDGFTLVSDVASHEVQGALAELNLTTMADTRSEGSSAVKSNGSEESFIQVLSSHGTLIVMLPGGVS